ncbi:MAG: class I SAM-dependent methyltransferase, partial [Candidatus Margulisbacteria bacterium]|nr:class I SAM-dependent methyltransferase [Candidatus Margulisiibacteriota bacterium]
CYHIVTMYKDYFQKVAAFYDSLVDRFNIDFRSGDNGTQENMLLKYRILTEISDLDYSSILEVGSNVGLFYKYLTEFLSSFKYTGIDISPRAYRVAAENEPDADFRNINILDKDFNDTAEYILADGLFNLGKMENISDYRNRALHKMFDLAEKGVAVNFLSSVSESKDESNLNYFDAGETLNFCLSLTPKAVLRHDYSPDNFTVYLYK